MNDTIRSAPLPERVAAFEAWEANADPEISDGVWFAMLAEFNLTFEDVCGPEKETNRCAS